MGRREEKVANVNPPGDEALLVAELFDPRYQNKIYQ